VSTSTNKPESITITVNTTSQYQQEIIIDDEANANCRRHHSKGRALPINCWECNAEFSEDEMDNDDSRDDE